MDLLKVVLPDLDRSLLLVAVEAPKGLQIALTAADAGQVCATAKGATAVPVELKLCLENCGRPINLICMICRSS